ncbi:MAG: hypothetical protein WD844_13055 [Thermoleophilaceae bacterium]
MTADLPSPTPELGAWLAANRETLIRRWLELVVERSTLEELAARPLAERVRELDLLLEAARSEGGARGGGLGPDLDQALEAASADGRPFALALLAPPAGGPSPEAWTEATAETARREERVVAAEGGLTAVVIPTPDADAARVEADRIRAGAWQLLGGGSVLPDVGFAMHPLDARDAAGLAAVAHERLPERAPEPVQEPGAAPAYEPPAFSEELRVSRTGHGALREELDRWAREGGQDERRDLWRELSTRTDAPEPDDDGPRADVTPLYPPPPE